MSENEKDRKAHSAEFFGESRDFWWNADFLELMGKRLSLGKAKKVLDVGCGVGHWSLLLEPLLSKESQLTGVDREAAWVKKANEKAQARGLGGRYSFQQGDVTSLPFSDGTFDLVTCQTVLIHLKDPKVGLREMLRVLKPGGTVLAVEPNNFSNRAIGCSLTENLSVDEVMDRLKFGLMIERGKQALGLGFNSVGDLIPGYLAELGAEGIEVYLSDKTTPFIPPYASKEQQVNIQQIRDWTKRRFIGWERDEVRGYFMAGGGEEKEFDRYYDGALLDAEKTLVAMEDGSYHGAGGMITYLISGRKRS